MLLADRLYGGSTILAWEALGKFPRAVRWAANLRVWLESDIDEWILEQHAKRNGPSRPSGADKTDGKRGSKTSRAKAVEKNKKGATTSDCARYYRQAGIQPVPAKTPGCGGGV